MLIHYKLCAMHEIAKPCHVDVTRNVVNWYTYDVSQILPLLLQFYTTLSCGVCYCEYHKQAFINTHVYVSRDLLLLKCTYYLFSKIFVNVYRNRVRM